jgi:hypothetical protein
MALALLTSLLLGQTMASHGDVLMRPIIPDPYLIRQQWAMRELNVPKDVRMRIEEESRFNPAAMRLASRTGKMPPTPSLNAANQAYQARLLQLSLWANDLHALTDPATAKRVGLTPSQQTQIDATFRAYFKWHKSELDRLTAASSGVEISKRVFPTVDPVKARAKMIVVRATVRNLLTANQHKAFRALKGKAPATIGPFGWVNCTPYVYLEDGDTILNNERVHEELGFTMRQSRQLRERLANNPNTSLAQEAARLSPQQRDLLAKLSIQKQGPMAILRCDVSEALGLSDALRDQLVVKVDEFNRRDMVLQTGDGHLTGRRQVWEERDRMLLAALTPAQRSKWNAMQGPKLPGLEPLRP